MALEGQNKALLGSSFVTQGEKQQVLKPVLVLAHARTDDHPPKRFAHDSGQVLSPLMHHGMLAGV